MEEGTSVLDADSGQLPFASRLSWRARAAGSDCPTAFSGLFDLRPASRQRSRSVGAFRADALIALSHPMYDVIVIGAGPAGLYTALRMSEEGLSVRVLGEHAEIGVPTHCTG